MTVVLSALAILVALRWMTWATIAIGGGPARTMVGGPVVPDVVVTAVAMVTSVLLAVLDRRRFGIRILLVLSSVAVMGLTVTIALVRIANANSFVASAWSMTSYGSGAVVGVLASGVMAMAALVGVIPRQFVDSKS